MQLHRDTAIRVFDRQVGDDVNLAMEIKADDVAVGQASTGTLVREVGRNLDVFVHRQHASVQEAERIHGPGTIDVFHVKHRVRVVVVMGRRDVNLIHPVHRLHHPRVGSESLRKHALDRFGVRDVRECILFLGRETRVPPVRGAAAIRIFLGDEIFNHLHRRSILTARQLGPNDVIMRDDPRQEALLHVHHRVQAQRKQIKRVLDEQRRPVGKLHVRLLIRLLTRRDVRELLTDVRRDERRANHALGHPARRHPRRRVRRRPRRRRRRRLQPSSTIQHHRRRDEVRPDDASRDISSESSLDERQRARHRRGRRHEMQRHVERVRVVPTKLARGGVERPHGARETRAKGTRIDARATCARGRGRRHRDAVWRGAIAQIGEMRLRG